MTREKPTFDVCFSEKYFDENNSARKDILASDFCNAFSISNFLNVEECQKLVEISEKLGFESVEWEYDPSYRDYDRFVGLSPSLSEILWSRVNSFLRMTDIRDIRPFGLETDGIWTSDKINECIRFTRYSKNHHLHAHKDGSFVWTNDNRIIYTLMIYLNDKEFEEGDTVLVDENGVSETVRPELGKCLIFNHDVVHEGTKLVTGRKYILRRDIMFQRIEHSFDPRKEILKYRMIQSFKCSMSLRGVYQASERGQCQRIYFEIS